MKKRPALLLDRDGVINSRLPGDYVKHPDEFVFEAGVLEAFPLLATHFGVTVVVTNQSGIGKGLMTMSDLESVHRKMRATISAAGGRIDQVYCCPHRSDAGCNCRKPATGMALQAQADFPDIEFTNAWIAGDSVADMQMGLALGMKTVLIEGKWEEADELAELPVDYRFGSLLEFARFYAAYF